MSDMDDPVAFVKDWYREAQIYEAIRENRDLPVSTGSWEFALWLTCQYRLAMLKGMDLMRKHLQSSMDAMRTDMEHALDKVDDRNSAISHLQDVIESLKSDRSKLSDMLAEAERKLRQERAYSAGLHAELEGMD